MKDGILKSQTLCIYHIFRVASCEYPTPVPAHASCRNAPNWQRSPSSKTTLHKLSVYSKSARPTSEAWQPSDWLYGATTITKKRSVIFCHIFRLWKIWTGKPLERIQNHLIDIVKHWNGEIAVHDLPHCLSQTARWSAMNCWSWFHFVVSGAGRRELASFASLSASVIVYPMLYWQVQRNCEK